MSFAKIALFALGLATIVAVGAANANAASYARHSYGWSSNAAYPGNANDAARFDPAKGFVQGY